MICISVKDKLIAEKDIFFMVAITVLRWYDTSCSLDKVTTTLPATHSSYKMKKEKEKNMHTNLKIIITYVIFFTTRVAF